MASRERHTHPAAFKRIVAPALVVLIGFTACSDRTLSPERLPEDTPQASYSAQERRAAERLSIGNVGAIDAAGSAYRQATLCVIALESVAELAEAGNAMTPEQGRAIEQARRLFEERAQRNAADDQVVSPDEERRALEVQYPETRQRAQLALGCLRRLQ